MKALVIGAGKIGRGFVAPILSRAGYRVTFADTDAQLVSLLTANRSYPVRCMQGEPLPDEIIPYFGAIDARDESAEAEAVAEADILAVCVGARNLPHVARPLAMGFRERLKRNGAPVNLLVCENLLSADVRLREWIEPLLPPEMLPAFRERIGLVEASVSIAVPVQTAQMLEGDPLRICTEKHIPMPIDADAIRGAMPPIAGLLPSRPFSFVKRRKLYVHNMGHAVCAYLGLLTGYRYLHEALAVPGIRLCVREAMGESALALAGAYGQPIGELLDYREDLIARFGNERISDTCERVGADPARKLQPDDRLLGPVRLCREQGISPKHIEIGAAAAYLRLSDEPDDPEIDRIYRALRAGISLDALLNADKDTV